MPDFEKIKKIIDVLTSSNNGWIIKSVAGVFLLWMVLKAISAIQEEVKKVSKPWLLTREEKIQRTRWQLFAVHVQGEISRLNMRESWNDARFAELEAEVEAEGDRRAFSLIPFYHRTVAGLRREKS